MPSLPTVLPTAPSSGVGLFPDPCCGVFFTLSRFQCDDFSLVGLTLHGGRCASLKQNSSFFSCGLLTFGIQSVTQLPWWSVTAKMNLANLYITCLRPLPSHRNSWPPRGPVLCPTLGCVWRRLRERSLVSVNVLFAETYTGASATSSRPSCSITTSQSAQPATFPSSFGPRCLYS